ncbi:uncharacterized protein BYT42DRAFT_551837 [Radiomyces spectabilis]|uniref:uncharacterized protein n=1 Tax=Radiomyces spectabilis TaxID=64574 RepID=UPI00221F5C04|nr:uncharacterized protein BYT42DRAFT_551837 [Radiomyces spectabilis]KAI8393666.1 hypothetical protein BYT42DRAFT_551837 [Radiomyces spectabilis]
MSSVEVQEPVINNDTVQELPAVSEPAVQEVSTREEHVPLSDVIQSAIDTAIASGSLNVHDIIQTISAPTTLEKVEETPVTAPLSEDKQAEPAEEVAPAAEEASETVVEETKTEEPVQEVSESEEKEQSESEQETLPAEVSQPIESEVQEGALEEALEETQDETQAREVEQENNEPTMLVVDAAVPVKDIDNLQEAQAAAPIESSENKIDESTPADEDTKELSDAVKHAIASAVSASAIDIDAIVGDIVRAKEAAAAEREIQSQQQSEEIKPAEETLVAATEEPVQEESAEQKEETEQTEAEKEEEPVEQEESKEETEEAEPAAEEEPVQEQQGEQQQEQTEEPIAEVKEEQSQESESVLSESVQHAIATATAAAAIDMDAILSSLAAPKETEDEKVKEVKQIDAAVESTILEPAVEEPSTESLVEERNAPEEPKSVENLREETEAPTEAAEVEPIQEAASEHIPSKEEEVREDVIAANEATGVEKEIPATPVEETEARDVAPPALVEEINAADEPKDTEAIKEEVIAPTVVTDVEPVSELGVEEPSKEDTSKPTLIEETDVAEQIKSVDELKEEVVAPVEVSEVELHAEVPADEVSETAAVGEVPLINTVPEFAAEKENNEPVEIVKSETSNAPLAAEATEIYEEPAQHAAEELVAKADTQVEAHPEEPVTVEQFKPTDAVAVESEAPTQTESSKNEEPALPQADEVVRQANEAVETQPTEPVEVAQRQVPAEQPAVEAPSTEAPAIQKPEPVVPVPMAASDVNPHPPASHQDKQLPSIPATEEQLQQPQQPQQQEPVAQPVKTQEEPQPEPATQKSRCAIM